MIGNFINLATILVGGILGTLFGKRLSENLRQTVIYGLGLFVTAYGISMFLKSEQILVPLGGLLFGGMLGEWWKIEESMDSFGKWVEKKVSAQKNSNTSEEEKQRFIKGFVMASLIFCVGPMAILGAIQDGIAGEYQTLALKGVMDGFAALAFSSTLGMGVVFSALPVFIYQGVITLLAIQMQNVMSPLMINEMTAVGGVIIMGLGISGLLELKKIRMGSFLPALFITPLLVWILELLNIL
ncbi:MAG: DUF554 domain-containing protein [Anaerolineaceae bacterium]|nr:DUF554 domain-containing protein [Anaerolineaceae bacterium]